MGTRVSILLSVFLAFNLVAHAQDLTPSGDESNSFHLKLTDKNDPEFKQPLEVDASWSESKELTADDLKELRIHQSQNPDLPVQIFEKAGEESQTKSLKESLTTNGISHETVQLSNADAESLKLKFSDLYVKPTGQEVRLGITMGAWRATTSAMVWFTSPGIHPALAAGLTALQTSLVVFNYAYVETLENGLTSSLYNKNKKVSPLKEYGRRQLYSLALTEIVRMASGPVGAAHSAFSLGGQMEILTYLATMGTGDAVLSAQRAKYFAHDRKTNARFGFITFATLAPLTVMELSGSGTHVLLDLHYYQIRETTAVILGMYATLAAAVRFAPETTMKLTNAPFELFEKARKKLSNLSWLWPPSCSQWFKARK